MLGKFLQNGLKLYQVGAKSFINFLNYIAYDVDKISFNISCCLTVL